MYGRAATVAGIVAGQSAEPRLRAATNARITTRWVIPIRSIS